MTSNIDMEMEPNEMDKMFHHLQLRQYQIDLVETARKQNSIIFLPPGTGKTFISLMVLRSRLQELKKPMESGGKIAVLLGTTKPLVKQLARTVEENTSFQVKVLVGEMGVDAWSLKTWESEVSGFRIFSMPPAIFLMMIHRNIIKFSSVTLLVLDECHHAVFNHPYRMIMKELPKEDKPLILGLTATVLNGNPHADGYEEVQALKQCLQSTFAKTASLEEALKYGAAPSESYIEYDYEEKSDGLSEVLTLIEKSRKRLDSLKIRNNAERRREQVAPVGSILLHKSNILVKEIRNMYRLLEKIAIELGLYAFSIGVLFYLLRMDRQRLISTGPAATAIIRHTITILNLLRRTSFQYMIVENQINIRKFSSSKVNKLIDYVAQYKYEKNNRCLIFVEERLFAAVLSMVFTDISEAENDTYFKAEYITGGLFSSVIDQEESLFEQKQYKEVLSRFGNEKFNFLFATDVAEEGIDLPFCSLVIRFNEPKDYRSYIQCKGRARFKDSKFIVFYKKGDLNNLKMKINTYQTIQNKLLKVLHNPEEWGDSDGHEGKEKDEEVFYSEGPDGPHITGTEAISLIHWYCNRLPQDNYSYLAPVCWFDVDSKKAFIQLPSSSLVSEIIEGDPKRTRKLAKKNVFLKAVKRLIKAGEIKSDFSFRSYKCSEENYKEHFPHFKKENEEGCQPGSSGKRRYYPIQWAKNLSNCLPQPGSLSYIHVIEITPKFERPDDSRLGIFYDLMCACGSYAILSSKPLSKICDFSLYYRIGEFNCHLIVNASTVILNSSDLQKIRKFHFFLFDSLLGIVNRLQIFDNGNCGHSFFVIPVRRVDDKFVIDWHAVNYSHAVQDFDLKELVSVNPSIEDYCQSVVLPTYRKTPGLNRYYIATSIDRSQTPMSRFPSHDFDTYYDYFMKKYNIQILDIHQPLIEVKLIPDQTNYLTPKLTSVSKKNRKTDEKHENFQEHLIPELCWRFSFPASFWLKATVLPSALYRITSLSCIDDFRRKVVLATGIGVEDVNDDDPWLPLEVEENFFEEEDTMKSQFIWGSNFKNQKQNGSCEDNDTSIQSPVDLVRCMNDLAPCDMKHYVKYFRLIPDDSEKKSGVSKSQMDLKRNEPIVPVTDVPDFPLSRKNLNERGPELRDFVKVFTCKSANDIVNLENLEFYGDSFLKFATSLYLFRKYEDNEGVLVSIKDRIVRNRNLYYCALAKDLQGALIVNQFEPKSDWTAPLFRLPDEIKSLINQENGSFELDYSFEISAREKLTGKLSPQTVRDIQSFIHTEDKRSVYTPDDGILLRKTIPDKSLADCIEALIGLFVKDFGLQGGFKILNWLDILPSKDGSYGDLMKKEYVVDHENDPQVMKALNDVLYNELEDLIGYQFKKKVLLLEALTHPSFMEIRLPSYQRLEFLGDSILDFLTTVYIYNFASHLNPGRMTDIRSAIVSNVTLACLTVKFNIHKYLLHHSSPLVSAMSHFANYQRERNHKIDITAGVILEEQVKKEAEGIEVPKALGDIFESIIGAVFLDSGNSLETVWRIFYRLAKDAVEEFIESPPKSPIRVLYESKCKPEFRYWTEKNGFAVASCKIFHNEEHIFYGKGSNSKKAKLSAAKLAVKFLEKATEEINYA